MFKAFKGGDNSKCAMAHSFGDLLWHCISLRGVGVKLTLGTKLIIKAEEKQNNVISYNFVRNTTVHYILRKRIHTRTLKAAKIASRPKKRLNRITTILHTILL